MFRRGTRTQGHSLEDDNKNAFEANQIQKQSSNWSIRVLRFSSTLNSFAKLKSWIIKSRNKFWVHSTDLLLGASNKFQVAHQPTRKITTLRHHLSISLNILTMSFRKNYSFYKLYTCSLSRNVHFLHIKWIKLISWMNTEVAQSLLRIIVKL